MGKVMAIDLKKLRYVVEVARAEGITTAANTICITQSALTRSIAEVEDDLGLQLFQRLPRGVRLTPAGRLFVEKARQILAGMEDLVTSAGDYRDLNTGRLRVGVSPGSLQGLLYQPVVRFIQKYPGLGLEMIPGLVEDLIPQVVGGHLDLIIGTKSQLMRWRELDVHAIKGIQCVVIVRQGHPLSMLSGPTESDVLRYPMILPASMDPLNSEIDQMCARNNLPAIKPRYVTDDLNLVRRIIQSTDAFSSLLSIEPDYQKLQMDFCILSDTLKLSPQTIAAAVHNGRLQSPAASAFISEIREDFGDENSQD